MDSAKYLRIVAKEFTLVNLLRTFGFATQLLPIGDDFQSYVKGATKLLLCQILLGKTSKFAKLRQSDKCTTGYDRQCLF